MLCRVVFYKNIEDCANKQDERRIGTQIESCDLSSDSGTDIGTHDYADGLGQCHQSGIDEADHHHICCGRALDQKSDENSDYNGDEAVCGCPFQYGAEFIAGGLLETGGHHAHTIEKQSHTAK